MLQSTRKIDHCWACRGERVCTWTRSPPKIFTAVADALQWIMAEEGVESLHYLDDFILFGSPDSPECKRALEKALEICRRLGVPIAVHKTEGPVTVIVFLGIEIDTVEGMTRLPEEKLRRLQREIRVWRGRHVCTKRELLSLIGQLQHACCVVRAGRTFLRRMISLAKVAKFLHHWIRVPVRPPVVVLLPASMEWGQHSLQCGEINPDGSHDLRCVGCGAFTEQGEWFQLVWPESWEEVHITVKELLPIVVGAALWADRWVGRTVKGRCDSEVPVRQ